jgi:hypothetical protein
MSTLYLYKKWYPHITYQTRWIIIIKLYVYKKWYLHTKCSPLVFGPLYLYKKWYPHTTDLMPNVFNVSIFIIIWVECY